MSKQSQSILTTENLTKENLSSLFQKKEGPAFLSINYLENTAESTSTVDIALDIPSDLNWFNGHFPGTPVLPGITQINWAGIVIKNLFKDLNAFKKLTNIKFKNMILPETPVILSISRKLDKTNPKQLIKFSYHNDKQIFSTGTFTF